MILNSLRQLVGMLRADSGKKYKQAVLVQHGSLVKNLLAKIYDPQLPFYMTSKNVDKNPVSLPKGNTAVDIFGLLYNLSHRVWTGDKAIYEVSYFIACNSEYSELICNIIDKDLKCGISTKTINSAWPGLIFDFESNVPLADVYDPIRPPDFREQTWTYSRKLDGVRCLCVIDRGLAIFFSRKGKRFETLGVLRDELYNLDELKGLEPIVFDGEICLVNERGDEDFQSVMKEIRRKDHTIPNPRFLVFGIYYWYDFISGQLIRPLPKYTYRNLLDCCESIEWVHQVKINNQDHLDFILDSMPESWEGLMLRNGPTVFGRSNRLLKVKKFFEAEYKVEYCFYGDKLIDGVQTPCLSSVGILHEDNLVRVGSGFTDNQRIDFNDDSLILGKTITVKYKKTTTNQNGSTSLQFPIFKGIRNYE